MSAIRVESSDLETAQDHGTIIAITGTSLEWPFKRITFAGDHRSMAGLLALLGDGEDVDVAVEPWQFLGVGA